MLPWKTIVKFDLNSKRAKYLQLADTITNEIIQNRLIKGGKLPSSRYLATELSLNRKTILLAYDELIAQGWIEIFPSRGTFVKENLPITKPVSLKTTDHIERPVGNSHLSTSYNIVGSINDGIPDYRITPIKSLYKTARFLVNSGLSKSILTGEHFEGEPKLIHSLKNYLSNTRAILSSENSLMITRGSQMAIYLSLCTILSQGDNVIVGDLNYQNANNTIEAIGGILSKVPVTPYGLCIDQIESLVKSKVIKAVYVSPHHYYPTTATMPIENRLKLLELSKLYNFYIIEDDYDYDYHYSGSPILPLASIDKGNRVIYIGSFSKIFAPSIRIGYMYANAQIIKKCVALRKIIDRRGDPVMERALSILIEENEVSRSIKKAVAKYKIRRDLFCSTLKSELGDSIQFDIPEGGMAIWSKFNGINIGDLIIQCQKNGLLLDIDTYHCTDHCRLGFASMNENEILFNTDILSKSYLEILKK